MADEIAFHSNSVVISVSEQEMAMRYGFRQLYHMEPVTPTPEQVAAHARAEELLREVEENPYIFVDGYDGDLVLEPLQTERWVFDETDEEWMTSWREHRAAYPDEEPPQRSWIDQMAARIVLHRPGAITDAQHGVVAPTQTRMQGRNR